MAADHFDVDVVIVGGGPVGASLAGDLGRRGVRTLVVEQGDGVVRDARMHQVNIRTMEILRSYGVEEEMRACGWPTDHPQDVVFVTRLDGYEIARIPWPAIGDMSPPAHSPTFAQRCPQAWFNPIMLRFAQRQPAVELRFLTTFLSFTQDDHGVDVQLQKADSGATYTVRCRYLVGCDGSRSEIRRALPVTRQSGEIYGSSAEAIFRAPKLRDMMAMPNGGRFITVGERGMSASLLPFDGKDLYRLVLMVQPERVDAEAMAEEIRAITYAPFDFELTSPVLEWVNRKVSASSYAIGRVVLAGDSAHGMPPSGGFGMNTGLVDAYDLGWRLAALVQGWGGKALLDSYDIERRQAVARISGMASDIYLDWVRWGPRLRAAADELSRAGDESDAFRRTIGAELAADFDREFNPQGGALGYSYAESPIVAPDGTPAPEDTLVEYVQTARPGHRAPHFRLPGGRSSLDLFGGGFTLFFVDAADAEPIVAAARTLETPLQAVALPDGEARSLVGGKLLLVRPDGMVAWRADQRPHDAGAVLRRATGKTVVTASAATLAS